MPPRTDKHTQTQARCIVCRVYESMYLSKICPGDFEKVRFTHMAVGNLATGLCYI